MDAEGSVAEGEDPDPVAAAVAKAVVAGRVELQQESALPRPT